MKATDRSNDFRWAAEVDDCEPDCFETQDELQARLEELEQRGAGELRVFKDYGKTRVRWWERLLLLGKWHWHTTSCFVLYWADDCATLMFHDEAASEFRAYDRQHFSDDAPAELRRRLNFGEPTPAPREHCLPKSRAFQAAREFLETEVRPEWLSYQYVP